MEEVKYYIIITAEESLHDLAEAVHKKIIEGYFPVGNIGVKNHGTARHYRTYYQAMIWNTVK